MEVPSACLALLVSCSPMGVFLLLASLLLGALGPFD